MYIYIDIDRIHGSENNRTAYTEGIQSYYSAFSIPCHTKKIYIAQSHSTHSPYMGNDTIQYRYDVDTYGCYYTIYITKGEALYSGYSVAYGCTT